MELILFILFVMIIVIVLSYSADSARNRKKKMTIIISEVSGRLGIELEKGSIFSQPKAYGICDGFRIGIRPYRFSEEESNFTKIRIFINHKLPIHGLMGVSRENKYTAAIKEAYGEDILTGDMNFDGAMYITGTYPYLIASLFSGDIRARILALVGQVININLTSSWLEVFLDGDIPADKISGIARDAVSISADLVKAGDARGRLMANIREDPEPSVRAKCIAHLTGHFPLDGEITELLRESFKDGDVHVRVEAAKHLGNEGMQFLTGMLEMTNDLSGDMVNGIISAMGVNRYSAGIPVLKKLFAERTGKALELAILDAFRNMGDPDLSDFLLSYLKRRDDDVRRAILYALETCGTVEAVEPLLKFSKTSIGPFIYADVMKAIAGIQSRLGGADAGWLSVTEAGGTDGALSMSDGPGDGGLSLHPGNGGTPGPDNKTGKKHGVDN